MELPADGGGNIRQHALESTDRNAGADYDPYSGRENLSDTLASQAFRGVERRRKLFDWLLAAALEAAEVAQ